jgi:hypothetical protein
LTAGAGTVISAVGFDDVVRDSVSMVYGRLCMASCVFATVLWNKDVVMLRLSGLVTGSDLMMMASCVVISSSVSYRSIGLKLVFMGKIVYGYLRLL